MSFSDYVLYEGSNIYHINSCDTIEIFYRIRTDLDKLECATDVTKLIKQVTTENENSYRVLQLYLNTLYMISETDKNLNWILSVFKLRLTTLLGYNPNVKECVTCKEKDNLTYFSIKNGGLKCTSCGKQDTSGIQIIEGTQLALKYIIMSPPKKLYSFTTSEETIKELQIISKLYMNHILDT